MENSKMKRSKTIIFIAGSLILLLIPSSCNHQIVTKPLIKKIEYRNDQMIQDFSIQPFLPQNTIVTTIPGKNKNWIIGDFDKDSLGEILFAYHYKNTSPDNPTMGAMLLKQEDGKWVKKYEYREKAYNLYIAETYDFTGDGKDDLILGWETNPIIKEKLIYLYRWNNKDLESLGNFYCTKLTIADFDGIYGQDSQYELGIWKQTETSLSTDVFRWNEYTNINFLFPIEISKSYTEQYLSRAEDLEQVYNKDYVIPELQDLEKNFPNDALYDFALIQSYIKAFLPDKALQKIDSSEDILYQTDFEKIPFIKAQAYFLQGEIFQGNQLLQSELSKTIKRIDAGTTLQLLGRSYVKLREWDKAKLAFDNAQLFHIPIPENFVYDSENQFQLSLAKDKARLEVLIHISNLRKNVSNKAYKDYFQNQLLALNKDTSLPSIYISEFYLPFNKFSEPYAKILTWEENGKDKEIVFMSIDEDQHKIKLDYFPSGIINEKTKSGWRLSLTFKEKQESSQPPKQYKKIVIWEKNAWKLFTVLE
jgi:hypothetical protein